MLDLHSLPKPFFVLAPMDDVTDTVFRQIVADCARPDLYFTEFVNVDGLQSPGRKNLLPKLRLTDKERPIIAQIWGKNPENFYKTTKDLIEMGYGGVDLNMGCPVKNVIQNGMCSALINNRELAQQIITEVGRAVGESANPNFSFSVKTRIGFREIDMSWLEFLLTLPVTLNMLTIHGRTVRELSKVPAHWDVIGQVRKMRDSLSPDTLVVGNGDVTSRKQGEELAEQYKLDGIMIGRGIFEDPFVFAKDSPWASYTKQQKTELYKKHVELFLTTWQNNERKIHTLNKFCKIYINGFDGAKEWREKLMNAENTQQLLMLLKSGN